MNRYTQANARMSNVPMTLAISWWWTQAAAIGLAR
jgi:hypothetical protein